MEANGKSPNLKSWGLRMGRAACEDGTFSTMFSDVSQPIYWADSKKRSDHAQEQN